MAAPAKLISTSIGFQDPKGNVVANGMLMLTLSQTATVTATGGQVTTEPIFLNLDANGKITSTAIWFIDELSPSGLIYYGVVYAANKIRMIPGLDKLQYSITGASFDLATATQSGPASPSYGLAVMQNPAGGAMQTITGPLTATYFVGGATATPNTFNVSTFATSTAAFAIQVTGGTNSITTVGNVTIGGDTALSSGKVIKWNNDTGLSRLGATIIAVGNGTAGDVTGNLTAASFVSGTTPVALSGLLRGPNNTSLVSARNAANSGDIAAVLVNGSNLVALGSGPFLIPAASDTAVGKATTDVLTNKDLRNTGSGNAVTLLNQQGAVAAITGNGTDQTLYTFTIPANTIQAGKGFRVKWYGSNNAVATTLSLKLKIGATTLFTLSIAASSNYMQAAEIFNNAGVQNAQTWAVSGTANVNVVQETFGTSAENFANAIAVTVTGNIANPNTFQGGLWMVELIQ